MSIYDLVFGDQSQNPGTVGKAFRKNLKVKWGNYEKKNYNKYHNNMYFIITI